MPASPSDLELVDPVADTQLEMTVGGRLVVRLTESPTTGYRWHYALTAQSVLECARDDYVSAGRARGSGGSRSISFRALSVGATAIEFSLQRAWEGKPPARTLRVSVEVVSP